MRKGKLSPICACGMPAAEMSPRPACFRCLKERDRRFEEEERRLQELEDEGMSRSDAQGVLDAEYMKEDRK